MKITYFAAASRDGFIARENGDVSWLDQVANDSALAEVESFMQQVDGLLMGRKTYDFIFEFGSWPYQDTPAWVCTSRELESLPGACLERVDNVEAAVAAARAIERKHLWLVGGGRLASSLYAEDLLTHLSISQMPIDLKHGIPLFANHVLGTIRGQSRSVVEKDGYRQIEITIREEV